VGIRASWHLPAPLAVDDVDPFAAPIEDVGVPVRLADGTGELGAELVHLVKRERTLRDAGTACPIRDMDGTSCSACPIAGRYGALCDVGRRQEQLLTELAVHEVTHGR
jgi:hypothetical protein